MKFSFEVGEQNKHMVSFSWNQLWGSLRIKIDGKTVAQRNIQLCSPVGDEPEGVTWHFAGMPIQLLEKWEFVIEDSPDIHVRIEKMRPQLFAAFRPHSYCAKVNGEVVIEKTGF